MILGERIRSRLKDVGETQASLAREIGVTPQAISKLVVGGTTDTSKLWQIARFLQTTPEYLTGESDEAGDVTRVLQLKRRFSRIDRQIRLSAVPDDDVDPEVVEIDQVDLRYGMGGAYVEGHVPVEKRQFSRAWLRQLTSVAPEHLAWTKGDGDSMEPTIRSDEVVLVDRSKTTPGMDDKIWVCAVGEVGMIKRLRAMPSGVVEIHSDNPHVPMATAVDGELHVIGRVIAVVRKL